MGQSIGWKRTSTTLLDAVELLAQQVRKAWEAIYSHLRLGPRHTAVLAFQVHTGKLIQSGVIIFFTSIY